MKVKQLINMLAKSNLNADLIFKINENSKIISVSSEAECRCKEKEVILNIGKSWIN